MTRVNKIIKYHLEGEIDPLIDNGASVYKIADIIKDTHSDKPELANISQMSIQRYKDIKTRNKLIEADNDGKDITEVIVEEFRKADDKILSELDYWMKEGKELYKDAKKDGSYSDKSRIYKENVSTLMQQLKAHESKVQFGTRQFKIADNINQKKVQNLNIFMTDLASNILCDECKKRVLNKLKGMVED